MNNRAHQQDPMRPSAKTIADRMMEDLLTGLQLETVGALSVPPADMMRRDIARLEERLRLVPLDAYAPYAKEMIEDLKNALKDYHHEDY